MQTHPALASFRDWMTLEYRSDGSYDEVCVLYGADAGRADLAIRLDVGKRSYYEACITLDPCELQAGFATEGRVINEAVEQMILDNGGDLDDLLVDELCDLGDEPLSMEHFFERPAFRFIARMPLSTPAALEEPALRSRVRNVIKACRALFQACVDEA
jgi:hypothetical protein